MLRSQQASTDPRSASAFIRAICRLSASSANERGWGGHGDQVSMGKQPTYRVRPHRLFLPEQATGDGLEHRLMTGPGAASRSGLDEAPAPVAPAGEVRDHQP